MTGGLILRCSRSLISNGDHTQLIGLPMCTTVRWKDSTCAIGTQVRRQWTPSLAIGVGRIIGGVFPILDSLSFKTCSEHQSSRYIGGPPVVLSAMLAVVIGTHPAEFVKEIMVFSMWEFLILPGISGSFLFIRMPNTKVWALQLDFCHTGSSFE